MIDIIRKRRFLIRMARIRATPLFTVQNRSPIRATASKKNRFFCENYRKSIDK